MGIPTLHEIVRKTVGDYSEMDNNLKVHIGDDVERVFNHFYGYHPSMKNYDMPEMKRGEWKWLEKELAYREKKIEISEFGKLVADILGHAWDGLHHCNPTMLFHKRTDWSSHWLIEIVIYGEMATWDFNRLSKLAIMCHDQCIRFSVQGANINYMRLFFHKRKGRQGEMHNRHPTIEEQIKNVRSNFYVLPDL